MSISPDWDSILSDTLREPALAPFARTNLEPSSSVILWADDGQTVLYANEPGALLVGLSARPASAARMSLLARHLAPIAGVRLERLTFGSEGKPVTAACRRLEIKGFGSVLLTISSAEHAHVPQLVAIASENPDPFVQKPSDHALALSPAVIGPQPDEDGRAQPAAHSQGPEHSPDPAHARDANHQPAELRADAIASPPAAIAARPTGTVRFLWDVNADGRLTRLSPEFGVAFGDAYAASLLGSSWSELASTDVSDPSGAVAHALLRQQTWSGLTVLWRVPDSATGVAVDLSGLPFHDAGRQFSGFRGFGIARMNRSQPMPVVTQPITAELQDAPVEQLPAPIMRDIVVPLRPRKADGADGPILPGSDASGAVSSNPATPSIPQSIPKPVLSPSERHAFRDIARALGARMAGETALPVPASEPVTSTQAPADIIASISPLSTAVKADSGDSYAELLDKLPIGVLVTRGQRTIYANKTLLLLLGHDTLDDLAALGDAGQLFKGTAPEEGSGPIKLVAQDGESVPVDARLSAITWKGAPATLMAFRRVAGGDTSAFAKALELDLARRNDELAELTAILNTATDGVVTLDERGRLLSMNSAAEALFGYDQNEVVGEPITLLLAGESHGPALDYLEGLNGGGVASVMNDGREVIGRVRQGGTIALSMTMGRIREGRDAKFCAVLRDMTAWKKVESDLTAAKKAAEAASTQKSDILAKISHEIRTPLNAIIGFSEVMSSEAFGPIGNDRYKEYLGDIRDSGSYVISLVNDLLDLAKIEAGRLDLDFVSVSLNDIATSAVALLQPEAARGRVVLRTGLTQKLPPVVADQRSLRQIVINLLSNAVKFTDAGGQVIVSTALGDRGEALLRVRDTGIGMDDKELKLALEPFRQVPNTRKAGGTGLGLPLTKALIEANRGEMLITSVKGEGTLVEVVFPPQRVLSR